MSEEENALQSIVNSNQWEKESTNQQEKSSILFKTKKKKTGHVNLKP